MGGKNEEQRRQNDITQAQMDYQNKAWDTFREMYGKGTEYLQPTVTRNLALLSGDKGVFNTAIAPTIGRIDTGYTSAKDSIFNKIAPGAARDYALAGLERDRATSKATAGNQLVEQAYNDLAQIASGLISGSFQPMGGAARFGEGASQSNAMSLQDQAARKQSKLSFFGDLAKAGGAVAGGFAARP